MRCATVGKFLNHSEPVSNSTVHAGLQQNAWQAVLHQASVVLRTASSCSRGDASLRDTAAVPAPPGHGARGALALWTCTLVEARWRPRSPPVPSSLTALPHWDSAPAPSLATSTPESQCVDVPPFPLALSPLHPPHEEPGSDWWPRHAETLEVTQTDPITKGTFTSTKCIEWPPPAHTAQRSREGPTLPLPAALQTRPSTPTHSEGRFRGFRPHGRLKGGRGCLGLQEEGRGGQGPHCTSRHQPSMGSVWRRTAALMLRLPCPVSPKGGRRGLPRDCAWLTLRTSFFGERTPGDLFELVPEGCQ